MKKLLLLKLNSNNKISIFIEIFYCLSLFTKKVIFSCFLVFFWEKMQKK